MSYKVLNESALRIDWLYDICHLLIVAKINQAAFYAKFEVFFRGLKASVKGTKCKIVLRFSSSVHHFDE